MILEESDRSIIVTLEDALVLGYCMRSIRPFCLLHGISFRDFVDHGIEADVLLATNDQYALDMIENAVKRGLLNG